MPFDSSTVSKLRRDLGLTQRSFADAVGVPQSTVYRWEAGRSSPNATHLGMMADLGYENGLKPDWFPAPSLRSTVNRDVNEGAGGDDP